MLVNFWATWCPPCRAEMPTIEQAYRAYRASGLQILAISIDTEPQETVQAFVEALGLTFPALLDSDMTVIQEYRIAGIPGSVLIDRQGVIRAVEVGFRDSGQSRVPEEARAAPRIAVWCHLLLGVPVVIAALFLVLPWTAALPIALVLGIVTAVVGYQGARVLRLPAITGPESMVGRVGEAASGLDPEGLVRVGAELWTAAARAPVPKGGRVAIVGVQGAKLVVQPAQKAEARHEAR